MGVCFIIIIIIFFFCCVYLLARSIPKLKYSGLGRHKTYNFGSVDMSYSLNSKFRFSM